MQPIRRIKVPCHACHDMRGYINPPPSRGQLKCDGTRAETRYRLSAKRTSPFKSAGGRQFSRVLTPEVCASAVVMLDTPCSEVVWRVLAAHSIRQFPFHFPSCARHRVPSRFNWILPVTVVALKDSPGYLLIHCASRGGLGSDFCGYSVSLYCTITELCILQPIQRIKSFAIWYIALPKINGKDTWVQCSY